MQYLVGVLVVAFLFINFLLDYFTVGQTIFIWSAGVLVFSLVAGYVGYAFSGRTKAFWEGFAVYPIVFGLVPAAVYGAYLGLAHVWEALG